MNAQSETLRRAMEALNSVCLNPPAIAPRLTRARPPAEPLHDPPVHDPDAWREPFARWLDSTCVRDPRCAGGLGCLHIAFCEWAISHDDVPCNRLTFECLVRESGLQISEGLVCGLIFRQDFEAVGLRTASAKLASL
jgi:hypothetical protein